MQGLINDVKTVSIYYLLLRSLLPRFRIGTSTTLASNTASTSAARLTRRRALLIAMANDLAHGVQAVVGFCPVLGT
jgi:hypothetical protein